jgi:xanthine dehydrogenase accessory factor
VGAALIVSKTLSLLARGGACAWITVARTAGSAPREVGARMVVTREEAFDTIGGGQLEYRAIEIARALLRSSHPPGGERAAISKISASTQAAPNSVFLDDSAPTNHPLPQPSPPGGGSRASLERFPLSARVGQCCGGTVWLAIEALCANDISWLRDAQAAFEQSAPYARTRTLSTQDEPFVWHDTLRETSPQVFLFGAGHVGRALATILSVNDLQLTWIDSRDAQFPSEMAETAPQVLMVESDAPVAEIANAPPHAHYLVMTHSHALDYDVIEAILERDDAAFIGLIGSATKRAQFEQRLRARGFSSERIATITCPIGEPTITSKHPGAIATAVAAQLLSFIEQHALVTH